MYCHTDTGQDRVDKTHLSLDSVVWFTPMVQPARVILRVDQWPSRLKQSHDLKSLAHICACTTMPHQRNNVVTFTLEAIMIYTAITLTILIHFLSLMRDIIVR